MVEINGRPGQQTGAAHEATGSRMGARQTTLGHRHRFFRFRYHRYLVCAPDSGQARADVFVVGYP